MSFARVSKERQNARSATSDSPTESAKSQSLAIAADRLFTRSVLLDGRAIVDFVQALCLVSWVQFHFNRQPGRDIHL